MSALLFPLVRLNEGSLPQPGSLYKPLKSRGVKVVHSANSNKG